MPIEFQQSWNCFDVAADGTVATQVCFDATSCREIDVQVVSATHYDMTWDERSLFD